MHGVDPFGARLGVGIVAAALLASGRLLAATGCPPVAVVDGSRAIVRSVRALLDAHGVGAESVACTEIAVHALVVAEPDARGYRLHIVDGSGRVSERRVRDAVTAASLIESWAVPETDALVSPPPAVRSPARAPERISATATPVPQAAAWRLTAAAEVMEGTDRSVWFGGTVTGCARIGKLCLGGRLRYGRDDGLSGPDTQGGDLTRTAIDALALVALPLHAGATTVVPLVGVGIERLHTALSPAGTENEPAVVDVVGLRVEGGASVLVALSRTLSLVAEVNAGTGRRLGSGRSDSRGLSIDPPVGFVRAAIGCQYAP
jgi:hypothetical protein